MSLKVTRPIVRYHGGKWKLAPWILSNFPPHRIYVEAFGGGASVMLRKSRSYAEIYNDLDSEIVNLFKVARESGEHLAQQLRLTPFARSEFLDSYQPSPDAIEQARRTVVRSFMGFGSNSHNTPTGFRSNSNRSGSTPAHDWANYPSAFEALLERLQGVVIENRDASKVMLHHDSEETLHYVDPPYVMTTRDKGSDYRHEMTDEDHAALAVTLRGLQGMVVLSGYQCPLYSSLYSDWVRIDRKAFADGARARTESLWFNNSANSALSQQRLIA